jgi:Icc protein
VRAAWLTDIHLNFLSPVAMDRFIAEVRGCGADCILISGDIGEAPRLVWYLRRLENAWARPIYFVLGNHDFYMASFDEVFSAVRKLSASSSKLVWLREAGIIELTPDTALIGHDSWADGRLGDYAHSPVLLNDYSLIRDFSRLDKASRLATLNALGDEAAAYVREWLPRALEHYPRVIFLTHVPPFRDACWHMGAISDDHFLPHFACKAVGDALQEIMSAHPEHQLTVLCGHTHSPGRAQILPNLLVITGGAEYGQPTIQNVLDVG